MNYSPEKLESFTKEIFCAAGINEVDSSTIARHLVLANLRGVDSHGVSKIGIYVDRFNKGIVNKEPKIEVTKETPVSALVDANNGPGIVAATRGIEIAVDKAKKSGIGIVGVNNSNHCGMLADYIQYAVEQDCITIATTNSPAVMAPWGGKERFFGTNPFSYGIPSGAELDIICDMATSVVAKGKIILAQKNNEQIPLGWAISKDGKETTDPHEAVDGLILPMGGPKGYGLTFLVETLSSLFTGASFGPHVGDLFTNFDSKQDVGQFFYVMRADLFQDMDQFKLRMDQMIREIKEISPMEGVDKIYLPGEIELLREKQRREEGIPLTQPLMDELDQIASELNVQSPFESGVKR